MKTFLNSNSKLLISLLIVLIVLVIPRQWYPIPDLTYIEHKVFIIFVFAAVFWVLEPIPAYATSILVIVLELIMISDKSFLPFREMAEPANLISYKSIFSTFSSPIILLFLGGFFMAIAATKYELDQNFARFLLKPFGAKPHMVMLGLMVVTAIFSMFMSNTATTAMMLAIVYPIVHQIKDGDPAKIAFLMCIPLAANVGGIGTPIGTPPNAIAMKYLVGIKSISFGEWMLMGVPFVIVMLMLAWVLLRIMFKPNVKMIKLDIAHELVLSHNALIVLFTFVITVLLWMTESLHGMNAYIVAMIPVGLFLATGIVDRKDLEKISWDVLWLVSGGIALGLVLDKSGLAQHIIEVLPFDTLPILVLLVILAVIGMIMANFMSNTAAANLLLPIIVALAQTLDDIHLIGGTVVMVLAVTLSVSLGMSLPISTPPNALAFASGKIATKDMAKIGVIMGVVGVMMVMILMYFYHLTV